MIFDRVMLRWHCSCPTIDIPIHRTVFADSGLFNGFLFFSFSIDLFVRFVQQTKLAYCRFLYIFIHQKNDRSKENSYNQKKTNKTNDNTIKQIKQTNFDCTLNICIFILIDLPHSTESIFCQACVTNSGTVFYRIFILIGF